MASEEVMKRLVCEYCKRALNSPGCLAKNLPGSKKPTWGHMEQILVFVPEDPERSESKK